jgi:hypothetical protein
MELKELQAEKCVGEFLFNIIVSIGVSFFITFSFADVSSSLMVSKWQMSPFTCSGYMVILVKVTGIST